MFGGAVVRLARAAPCRYGREVDKAAPFLLTETRRGMAADVEGAFQVHGDDRIPFGLTHVEDHAVAQDAGRVDHDVYAAQLAHRPVDHRAHRVIIAHATVIGDGAATARHDVVHDPLRCARILS